MRTSRGDIGVAADCIGALFRGDESSRGVAGAVLIAEAIKLLHDVHTKG